MAFCTKCGTQIPDGAAVCPSCGQAQAGAQQTYQPQQAVPQYNAGPSLSLIHISEPTRPY